MEVSRLTFTKETKEKMEKPITLYKKGELRWKKLTELNDEGKLMSAKNRQDITAMMGLGKGYGAPYTWVSNMISRGYIKEILTGFDKAQRPEYEYHIVSKPDYSFKNRAKKAQETKAKKKIASTKKPVVVASTTTGKVYAMPTNDNTKMVIRYKDLVIELENISTDMVERIIDTLANK